MRKVAERSLKSLKSLSKTLIDFSHEVKLKNPIAGPSLNHTNNQGDSNSNQEFEPILLDIEQYIYHLTEAANIITNQFKIQSKSHNDLKSEA